MKSKEELLREERVVNLLNILLLWVVVISLTAFFFKWHYAACYLAGVITMLLVVNGMCRLANSLKD
tara:strand:+ start:3020 stop:3217 length:198 start_codon:yes stop_codon:yes gene_type:complete